MAIVKHPPDRSTNVSAKAGRGVLSPRRQLATVRSFKSNRRANSSSPSDAMNPERVDMSSIPQIISRSVDYCNKKTHVTLIDGFHSGNHHGAMDTKIESGRRIRERRDAVELKQREVCELIPGLTVTRLSNWEQGIRMISVDEAKRLAPVLKTSPGYLLTIDNDPGDPRLQTLIETYRLLDDRGRSALHRVAESECAYTLSSKDQHKDAA